MVFGTLPGATIETVCGFSFLGQALNRFQTDFATESIQESSQSSLLQSLIGAGHFQDFLGSGRAFAIGSRIDCVVVTAPPVALRELQVAARQASTRWIRLAAAIAGSVAVGTILLSASLPGSQVSGGPLFGFLVGMTALILASASVLSTCDTLSSEQRNGTLGLLFLTDLRAMDVVLGKFMAAGIGALGAVLSVFPLMAIAFVLGGITGGEFARTSLALLNLAWVYLALGLAMSARTSDASRALFASLAWGTLLGVALPVGEEISRQWSLPETSQNLFHASPVSALKAARENAYQLDRMGFWVSLAGSHFIGWCFLGFAARRSLRLWRREGSASDLIAQGRRTVSYLGTDNPIAALYGPTRKEAAITWSLVFFTVVAALSLWSWDMAGFPIPFYGPWPFTPAYFLLKCLFAWKCTHAFHELKDGAGRILLTTP